jgi:hypothetical protein
MQTTSVAQLQIQKFWVPFRRYQIFVGLERDSLSHMRITEKLLGRNTSGFGLGNKD